MSTQQSEANDIQRLEAFRELAEAMSTSLPHAPKEDINKMNRELGRAFFPGELQNVSAEYLRKRVLDDYIFDASIKLNNARETRQIVFSIRKQDADMLEELRTNWRTKGFTCTDYNRGETNYVDTLIKW